MNSVDAWVCSFNALVLQTLFLVQIAPAIVPCYPLLRRNMVHLPVRWSSPLRKHLQTLLWLAWTAAIVILLASSVGFALIRFRQFDGDWRRVLLFLLWSPVACLILLRIGNQIIGRSAQRSVWPVSLFSLAVIALVFGWEFLFVAGAIGGWIGGLPVLLMLRLPGGLANLLGADFVAWLVVVGGWIVVARWCWRHQGQSLFAGHRELRCNIKIFKNLPDVDSPTVGHLLYPRRTDDAADPDRREDGSTRGWRIAFADELQTRCRVVDLECGISREKLSRYTLVILLCVNGILLGPALLLALIFWAPPDPRLILVQSIPSLPFIGLAPGTFALAMATRWTDHGILRPAHALRLAVRGLPRELIGVALVASPVFVTLYLLGAPLADALGFWQKGLVAALVARLGVALSTRLDRHRMETVSLLSAGIVFSFVGTVVVLGRLDETFFYVAGAWCMLTAIGWDRMVDKFRFRKDWEPFKKHNPLETDSHEVA